MSVPLSAYYCKAHVKVGLQKSIYGPTNLLRGGSRWAADPNGRRRPLDCEYAGRHWRSAGDSLLGLSGLLCGRQHQHDPLDGSIDRRARDPTAHRDSVQAGTFYATIVYYDDNTSDSIVGDSHALSLDNGWHRYRMEVKGEQLRFLIDGRVIIRGLDSHLRKGGTISLANEFRAVMFRDFKIVAL